MKEHSLPALSIVALSLFIHFNNAGRFPMEFSGGMQLHSTPSSFADTSEIRIKVKDLSRKFLSFYDAASAGIFRKTPAGCYGKEVTILRPCRRQPRATL